MDLPITRLLGASLDGDVVLDFIDLEYEQLLMRLDPTTRTSGSPVLVCRDLNQNIVVFKITSDYELGAVAMRRAIGLLRKRLSDRMWPMYIALAYEGAESWFLGHEPVEYTQITVPDFGLVWTSKLI